MNFEPFIDALLTGTPVAILAAAVGLVWQILYTRSRDKLQSDQWEREQQLQEQRFEHEKNLRDNRGVRTSRRALGL